MSTLRYVLVRDRREDRYINIGNVVQVSHDPRDDEVRISTTDGKEIHLEAPYSRTFLAKLHHYIGSPRIEEEA